MPKDKPGEHWWSPLRIFGPAVVLALVALVVTYQFVDPAPPDRITIATGQPGSITLLATTATSGWRSFGNQSPGWRYPPTGSGRPASAKPAARSWHESQRRQGRPSAFGS